MAQSLSKVLLHVVFSTKNRMASIPQDLAGDLHAYLAGACRALGSEAYRVEEQKTTCISPVRCPGR